MYSINYSDITKVIYPSHNWILMDFDVSWKYLIRNYSCKIWNKGVWSSNKYDNCRNIFSHCLLEKQYKTYLILIIIQEVETILCKHFDLISVATFFHDIKVIMKGVQTHISDIELCENSRRYSFSYQLDCRVDFVQLIETRQRKAKQWY